MVERDTIFKGKIKQRGLFDFSDFYTFTYDYLMDENYDVFERKYVEKVKGDSKDVEIKWEAIKEISDYFRFIITADWIVLGMKPIEVQKEGKKIKMDSGIIEIKFKAILAKDYEGRWENHPFWKFFRGIYDRYIIRTRIEQYEERLLEEINEFIAQCKSLLAIEAKHEPVKITRY